VTLVLAGWLASGSHATPLSLASLYIAGPLVLVLVYVPLLRGIALRRAPRDRELERRVRRYSAPLVAFTVGAYVVGSVDLWVLGAFAQAATVGTYAAAYRAYTQLMTIATAATPVLMSLFVSLRVAGRGADVAAFLERVAPALVLLAGAAIAVAIAPAYAAAPLVFGNAFRASSLPLAILLVSVLAWVECNLLGSVLTAYDRTADSARAMVAAAALNVVADLVAIGVFGAGAWAPAAATAGCTVLMAAVYARAARACTAARTRMVLGAYAAPLAAVAALVLAPAGWRVWASLAAGGLGGAVTLIAGRARLVDLWALRPGTV
jgi:O-antigen/teichoic acid export membrane protein